jgi:cobalt-zinc-cadmium efflux system membrane fusion protein
MNNVLRSLTIILSLAVLSGCGTKESPVPAEHSEEHDVLTLPGGSIREIDLRTTPVVRARLTGSLTLAAHVVADQDKEARVGTLVPGRVQRVFAKAGDRVSKGDILMTIEGLDVGEIMAGYLKAKAALDYTKAAYERQKKLYGENVGSQKLLLEAQAEYEKALAELRAEDRRLHSVGLSHDVVTGETDLEHAAGTLPVHAPINGIVSERNVVIGQFVDASVTAFVILNTRTVWVDAQAYEKDLTRISRGASATFVADGRPDQKYAGTISFIGAMVDEHTRTITVRGDFRNPGLVLKPQMFGTMQISLPGTADGIIIPRESLLRDGGREYVFVQRSDTTFEKRFVTSGVSGREGIEISDGLNVGEHVVTSGAFYLKSEMKKEEFEGDEH